ncbi:coiled-coil domain-containing protein 15 isoform X2 [Syngnathoides biaculeatus]|uniref:coiled-coil domain-containing protein 15 isoform X2 n=1 Tax=Syngnathoides biaculeatus TaxID=300417 RepID=UPI002ADD63B4|nr:coiled-coil domain-containing protein 15 isoform X2 [Syngnathoides biaculeatus]
MFAKRATTAKETRAKFPNKRGKEHRYSKVLAERNQAVVAVGAWVEDGQEFEEDPCDVASFTDELQAEKQRENEESLRRFQAQVRHRVAVISKRRLQEAPSVLNVDRRIPKQHQRVPGKANVNELHDSTRQVRLKLAACQTSRSVDEMSETSTDNWKISLTRHETECDVLREEEDDDDDEDEDEEVEEDEHRYHLTSAHQWGVDVSRSDLRIPKVLWPIQDQEELKRQRQLQFLMHRRHFMSLERQRVKENNQHRKHLKKTARIKADKEKARLEEERQLERARQLTHVRQRLEERETLVLERLKLEEEEKAAELERRRRETEKGIVATRYIDALRSQVRDRMANKKLDLPPMCCCASSFWESHPDTCANNCVFHNNPKEYAQALHAAVLSLDLK